MIPEWSALDAEQISDSRDVGATAVYSRRVDGEVLSFDGNGFVDTSGTRWDLFGRGVAGPRAGMRLTPVDNVQTFWFAWSVFQPATGLWKGSGKGP